MPRSHLSSRRVPSDGTISGVQILFANASLTGSGGDLKADLSSVDVAMKAGERVGFFVVPDGFSQWGMSSLLADKSASFKFVDASGKAGNVNAGSELKLVHVASNGTETVVKSAYGSTVFHSVDNGSLGLNGDGAKHVIGEVDNINGTVKVGFEDLKGGGDNDFNDAVFTVSLGTTNSSLLGKEATKPTAASDRDDMKGGIGADKMFGMSDNDKMDGGAGDDQMWGNSGNDTMSGGDGNDVMSGGAGDDVMSGGAGNDKLVGNSGNDKFIADAGDDSYDGSSGFDTIDYSGASNGISVNLNAHTVTGMGTDTIKGVESVIGSAYADSLIGDKNANVFDGGAGDDTFRGRGGADTFTGGKGNDTYLWAVKDVGAAQGVDHIRDFTAGDHLNFHDLLKGQKFSSISDVVKVTDKAEGSTVAVKVGGAFVDVVTLDGVHGTSALELLKAGMILS